MKREKRNIIEKLLNLQEVFNDDILVLVRVTKKRRIRLKSVISQSEVSSGNEEETKLPIPTKDVKSFKLEKRDKNYFG